MENNFEELQKQLDILYNVDVEVEKIFEVIYEKTFANITKNKMRILRTTAVLTQFLHAIKGIKDTIFYAWEWEDVGSIYAVKILYRSIIEHYFRLLYIGNKYLDNKDDDATDKFLIYTELLEKENIFKKLKKSGREYELSNEINKAVDEFFKELKTVMIPNGTSLYNFCKKYSFGSIIEYLLSKKSLRNNSLLTATIFDYPISSCYVHGGVAHYEEMDDYRDNDEARFDEILRITKNVLGINTMTRVHYLEHFYKTTRDVSFKETILVIQNVVKDYIRDVVYE